jgi:hypothetical protein
MRDPLNRPGGGCKICASPFASAVVARIGEGRSNAAIGREFDFTSWNVGRHKRTCLPQLTAAVAKAATGPVVKAQLAEVSDSLALSAANLTSMIDEITTTARAALARFKDGSGDPKEIKAILDASISAAKLWGAKISAFPRPPTHVTDSRTLVLNGIDSAKLAALAERLKLPQ